MTIYYRHLLWKESEFYGESTGVFRFSIYRAHKSVLTIGAPIIFVRSKTKWHSIVSWRCFSAINLFLKKSTIDIYYEKNQNFMANRLVFLDFPSTVHTNLCLLYIGAPIIFVRSKTMWHSIVSWRCFSAINIFLKKIYFRHLLWKESEFYGESTGVFRFSIYRAHKSVLTIGAPIIFVRSKTKWHSIVSWRCFSAINLFLKKIYFRHLLWKESEFYGESTGVFRFSIYRAHKSVLTIGAPIIFVRSKTKRQSTIDIYYEKNQNFMANRLVFLDFPSTVHTNLCLV